MQRLIFALGIAMAVPAAAAPIDGIWKIDLASAQLSPRLKSQQIVNGIYTCNTCRPTYSLPADGKLHPVSNQPGIDTQLVRVVDANTVEMEYRKGGHLTSSGTTEVSSDGKTLTNNWKSVGANGKVSTGRTIQSRAAVGPKSSHAISGSWRDSKVENVDAAMMTMVVKEAGGMLHVSYPTGEGYDARIGGPAVPIHGDLAGTMASVRRGSGTSYIETETVKGKVITINTMTLTGPNTLQLASEDRQRGGVVRYNAHK